MNPQELVDMKNHISDLDISMGDIIKRLAAMSIDQGRSIKSNISIPPGIACKIAYDANGLVLNGIKLEADDIPALTIDKIVSLRKMLEDKVGFSDLKQLQLNPSDKPKKKDDVVAGVGTKISYNAEGLIVSSSDLNTDDIPNLPINKIENLSEKLQFLENQLTSSDVDVPKENIASGTFPKITYDSDGRVVSGSKLSIDDIPMDLIIKMNNIESKIPDLASTVSLSALAKNVELMIEGNTAITPGTFTKVTVDSKGLVTKGGKLTVKDLPNLKISDISKLESILNDKAQRSTVAELSEVVSSLLSSVSQIGEISGIKNELEMKADADDVKKISTKLNQLQSLMDVLAAKIPNDLIVEQLQLIQSELSSLSGRISVVERVLKMEDSFDITE